MGIFAVHRHPLLWRPVRMFGRIGAGMSTPPVWSTGRCTSSKIAQSTNRIFFGAPNSLNFSASFWHFFCMTTALNVSIRADIHERACDNPNLLARHPPPRNTGLCVTNYEIRPTENGPPKDAGRGSLISQNRPLIIIPAMS